MSEKVNYSSYPFTGIPTFLRSEHIRDVKELENRDISIAVMGVPFDEGCPYIPGSRFCARAIREQSLRFSSDGYYSHEEDRMFLGEELSRNRMVDMGDVNVIPTDVEGTFDRITELTRKVLDTGALLITLGGDHSITYPVVRAFDTPIHVVHFDAHADFLPILPGFENTNTHAFTHISKMPHVKSLTQIGYRSVRDTTGLNSRAAGNRVIGMDEFRKLGPNGIAECVPKGEPCYISIDIDVLDCTLVPGCVSAEPNGMTFNELRDALAAVAAHNQVLGFEMVEVTPQLDVGTGITSYLATQTLVELLGRVCDQPYWKERYK